MSEEELTIANKMEEHVQELEEHHGKEISRIDDTLQQYFLSLTKLADASRRTSMLILERDQANMEAIIYPFYSPFLC